MEKIKMQTGNLADEKYAALAELFPNALTEKISGYDEAGNAIVERAVDIDVIRQEIAVQVTDSREERYQFTWPGKKNAVLAANLPVTKTLRPCREESLAFDTTENLYIEGDNLDVLKLLRETYLGRIQMIYIDPPYNTGSDLIYNDDFSQGVTEYLGKSGQLDENGNRLVQNLCTNGRFHTDWLNMIYPRIRLAKDLLTEDGAIFISIDDNEMENMKKVCSEIFGERNFVNCFIWNCSTAGGIRPRFASKTHEYILCYAKNRDSLSPFCAPLSEDAKKLYTRSDERGAYRDKDFVFKNKSANGNQKYLIRCPDGEMVRPKEGYIYRFIRERFDRALSDGLVTFKRTSSGPLVTEAGEQAHWNIYIKKYLGDGTGAPATLIPKEMAGIYNGGTQCVQELFDNIRVFDNVKPVDLIAYFINMAAEEDAIVMDFFSGSATTAHAVMKLNAESGANRKFIMVQWPEETDKKSDAYRAGYGNICEIGKERIRRAGRQWEDKGIDVGFRVLKADSSNMKDVYYSPSRIRQESLFEAVDNIKEDRTQEDLLFQVMLDLGVLLSGSIEEKVIGGRKVFKVAGGFLIACFDSEVTEEVVKAVAREKPDYAVFRDSGMASDSVVANFEQIFAAYSPKTVRKVL